jgi:hypothetical protein
MTNELPVNRALRRALGQSSNRYKRGCYVGELIISLFN